jgi:hypothetical protein
MNSTKSYKRGPTNPRLRKSAKLYKNPSLNANQSLAWRDGFSEIENSIKNSSSPPPTPPPKKSKKGSKKKKGSNNNNLGLVFDINHAESPALLPRYESNNLSRLHSVNNAGLGENEGGENEDQLKDMYESQQPPVKTRKLQARKQQNLAAMAARGNAPGKIRRKKHPVSNLGGTAF